MDIKNIENKKSEVFSELDLQREKSHQLNSYPEEKTYKPKEKITSYKKKVYSAPTVINLEVTEACNVKCRHCYNPWRDTSAGKFNVDEKKFDYLLDEFIKNKVFHVIISGGEPLAKFDLACYAVDKLHKNNISTSFNSNLMLATKEKMLKLKSLGLDHVLTSWFSFYKAETDYITTYKGSFQKIIDGIKSTVEAGIRVSANTIVTQHNKNSIYDSGKFLHSLGVSQFFAHRVIPPAYDRGDKNNEHHTTISESKFSLDELLRLKKDTGMKVGTLINYPLCMLGDLEKYKDFVGRGCPTQSGHRFSINSNGQSHGCVMEDKEYGNVYEVGLKEAYARTMSWRNESYLYEGCKGCHYIDVCQSGCRMHGMAATGKMDQKDPLMPGKEFITKPYRLEKDTQIEEKIKSGASMHVPESIRFRHEKDEDFYLMNIRWGNTIEVTTLEGEFFIDMQKKRKKFSISDCKFDNTLSRLTGFVAKEALKSDQIDIEVRKTGVNIDPAKLPDLTNPEILNSHPDLEL
jgi:radical SAM protein with 4Fe4S-binding SPASM domain